VIFAGRPSLRNYAGWMATAGILIASGVVGMAGDSSSQRAGRSLFFWGAVFVAYPLASKAASSFRLTSERVTSETGLLSRKRSEVDVSDVRNIQVKQGVIQRMMGVGNVGISSAGQSGVEVVLRGVLDPDGVAELVRRARKKAEAASA
jgi:uncharacterized membrane protein YdbT with pleckstrin-like domain